MKQTYEQDHLYAIHHSRKGKFSIKITGQDDEWLSGLIVAGKAKAMLAYNELEAGEDITIRKSFILSSSELKEVS